MHIPDGFLDTKTWLSTALVSAGVLSYSVRQTNKILEEKQIPLLGAMGAFIFAGQMINFPVAGGTSGHLIGAALVALTMGPWAACVIMATIVGLQAIVFQDGGIMALGANVLNMATLAPLVAYYVYTFLTRVSLKGSIPIFLAAWLSTLAAAAGAAFQLAFSGTVSLGLVMPAMLGWHSLIGVGEGLITLGVVNYLTKVVGTPIKIRTEAGESSV